MATFIKPAKVKYTTMCIYIDAHMKDVIKTNENPQIEAQIYEYMYHVIYALSCKAAFFKNFADYDKFACYAATEVYLAMRKKLQHAGEIRHGKEVVPIKSVLNYIKTVLYPLKVNYQRENFSTVIDETANDKYLEFEDKMKESVQAAYRPEMIQSYQEALEKIPEFIQEVLDATPFKNDKLMYRKIYLSVFLTFLDDITLPNKVLNRFKSYIPLSPSIKKMTGRVYSEYSSNGREAILWHLDPRFNNYIRILVLKIKLMYSAEAEYYIHSNDMSDDLLEDIMYAVYDREEEGI